MRKPLLSMLFLSLLFFGALFQSFAQSPVPAGKGSYASFPPAEELQFEWEGVTYYNDYDFVYNNPIYVKADETRPIPTNDWWTNLLVEQYGGLMFAYPLVMQPLAEGLKIQYPTAFNASGTDLDRGEGLLFSADGFTPDKAIASNWSDWAVEMQMPDEGSNRNMTITMAHGIPFTYIETSGINPVITASAGASYYNASGQPATFPVSAGGAFVVASQGRLFGIHLGKNMTADITGKQYIMVDLGAIYPVQQIKLVWETAFAKGYTIQTSTDNVTYLTQQSVTNGDGGTDQLSLSGNARYVKVLLNERGSIFAYSLFELEVLSNNANVALNKPTTASSTQDAFVAPLATDGNLGTRWASMASAQERLVLNAGLANSHVVVSALTQFADLNAVNAYAHNKPVDTKVEYNYNTEAGTVKVDWNITTQNLNGDANGNTIQGFIPHHYKNTKATNVTFTNRNYVTARGNMRTSIGTNFSFTYPFGGILPSFTAPYKNIADANPYQANVLYKLVTDFAAARNSYGADTYWGGKDLVNLAKYTLMAKELNHQAYDKLRNQTREALIDWLTYTPGEPSKFFARYDRWKALIGFDQSYGSAQFTDNHFHYGYLVHAAALYGMIDPAFLADYGDMLKLVTKQYANWERNDTFLPYFRTFDPWIGHSYAGGTSSGGGNNQESTSEAVQSWVGMFLLGDVMGDAAMRNAAAFGYLSETAATMEYWFDWDQQNLPEAYQHNMVGILWNGGYSYGTYFSASPVHIHGIQYLPVCPGFKHLALNRAWAQREYTDMMTEAAAIDGYQNEIAFGDDWAHVALGFRLLFDPAYVAKFMDQNLTLEAGNPNYIMDYEVAGMTYFYTHAIQNLGSFSGQYYTNFPSGSVFEANGQFSHAVVFNPSATLRTCRVYNQAGGVVASFEVPPYKLMTYPELPANGQQPDGCYGLTAKGFATSGQNAIAAALDANMGTRWIAESNNPCSIVLDLGTLCNVNTLTVNWEVANAKAYNVQWSADSINWQPAASFTNMPMGNRTEVIDQFTEPLRYLRLNLTEPSTDWNYSIYELTVCGQAASAPSEPETNLALNKVATSSTFENDGVQPTNAVDGNLTTRWGSLFTDNQWLMVDLGMLCQINRVNISWETAMAADYTVQVSNNGSDFSNLITITNNASLENELTLNTQARYLRVLCTKRATPWGYSIYELEVYGHQLEALPQTHIEAENFTTMQGIALEPTGDLGSGQNVGWIDAADWMEYQVSVPEAGLYTIIYRVSSVLGNGIVKFQSGNLQAVSTSIPATGGWQTWQNISATVPLQQGLQTIRLTALNGGFNLNWFELIPAGNQKSAKLINDDKAEGANLIRLYPNPADQQITIDAPAGINRILIYNTDGRLVETLIPDNGNNATILLNGLSKGIYLVGIECNNQIHYQRIVKL